jgi:hypothetical protein
VDTFSIQQRKPALEEIGKNSGQNCSHDDLALLLRGSLPYGLRDRHPGPRLDPAIRQGIHLIIVPFQRAEQVVMNLGINPHNAMPDSGLLGMESIASTSPTSSSPA